MSKLEAPPPPGSDTPVPSDVVPRHRRPTPSPPDGLVPQTALEQRAERRERARREREQRAQGMPPHTPQPTVGAVPLHVGTQSPGSVQRLGPAPYSGPLQYPSHAPHLGSAPQLGYAPPPKRRLTRVQTRAALLGSLVGQTLLALATHLLVTALIVLLLWTVFSEGGNDGFGTFDVDSLTDVVAFWAHPSRVAVAIVIVMIVTGALAGGGVVASLLWLRSAGLTGFKRSIALAYATTTVVGGFVGAVMWPIGIIAWFFMAMLSTMTLTIGSMWASLFVGLAVGVLLSGVVGMLFGWMYLLAFRPQPTWVEIEAERRQAELDAERRAAEADAAEFGRGG